MLDNKNNKKIHNPKSQAPAVYIPCWLIQVPNNLLSYAAKILYGRLSQWSNEKGEVYRSYNQLAQEIGSSKRSINEYLRELREVGLIETFQPQAGGLNHFVFYDHPWMYEKLNEFLCYKSQPDPEQNLALPRAESCSTPEQNLASINIKEIKEIKEPPIVPQGDVCVSSFFEQFWNAYPKGFRKEKQKCQDIWKRKKLDKEIEAILAGIARLAASDAKWKSGYIPNPSTFLNGKRWEDEITPTEEAKAEEKKKEREEEHKKFLKHQEEAMRFRKITEEAARRNSEPPKDYIPFSERLKKYREENQACTG